MAGSDSRDILTLPPPPADVRLRYGTEPSQFLDLRLPPGDDAGGRVRSEAGWPVAVVVHGGFWRAAYSLDHIGHLCASLTTTGLATVSLEYRRLGERGGGWPGTMLDVAAGLDSLREIAPNYGLDLRRLVTIGHSAGGHLALWLAARPRVPEGSPLHARDPLRVHGAVALAGVVNLRRGASLGLSNHVVETLLGGSPVDQPERYAAASPFELLPLGVRQALVHGREDSVVPAEISQAFCERAREVGEAVRCLMLPGVGHFELIDPRSAARAAVLSALDWVVPGGPAAGEV
jgi:acetyl esterase/lipase